VLVKTFALERRRIETRLLTFQQNEWQGYSFQWNDEQTDAELVQAGGADRDYKITDSKAPGGMRSQKWHFPSRSECMVCHSRATGYVIGLHTLQMNRVHDYGDTRVNQIDALGRLGALRFEVGEHVRALESRGRLIHDLARQLPPHVPAKWRDRVTAQLDARVKAWWAPLRSKMVEPNRPPPKELVHLPAQARSTLPRLTDPADASADVATRARSYLHANCAHCHVWAGGGNAAINLSILAKPAEWKTIDEKPLHHGFDLPNARIIAPGAPERSTLLYRVTALDRGRMPPLASSVVDDSAAKLLRDWIRSLPPAAPVKKQP